MKILLIILSISLSSLAFGQSARAALKSLPTEHRTIIDDSFRYEVEVSNKPIKRPKATKHYYWVEGNRIDSTMGGASGKLLHGSFQKFAKNGSLVESGSFSNGQKIGVWSTWSVQKQLTRVNYKKGQKTGKEIVYSSDGLPISSKSFKKGLLNGASWVLDENGRKKTVLYEKGIERSTAKENSAPTAVPLKEVKSKTQEANNHNEDKKKKKPRKKAAEGDNETQEN